MMQPQPRPLSMRGEGVLPAAYSPERVVLPFTRWAFYGWMFSLPFDVVVPEWLPGILQGYLSFPRIAGALVMLCFIVDPKTRPWRLPPGVLAFAAFFFIFALGMLRSGFGNILAVLQQLQLLVLFLISYNLFLTGALMRGALFSFAAATGLASIMTVTGLAVDPTLDFITGGREAAFGADPNIYSLFLVIGMIVAVGLAHVRKNRRWSLLPVLWGVVSLNVIAVGMSGSRGSSIALVGALLVFLCSKGSFFVRLRNVVLLAIIGSVVAFLLTRSEVFMQRWADTMETGTTANRDRIFFAALGMVAERPVIGWGPRALDELGDRLTARQRTATHNMALAILTFGGLAAFLPYMWGYLMVFRRAWSSRAGSESILPLMIFATIFVSDMITGGLPAKIHWTFFGYILAAGQLAVWAAKSSAPAGLAMPLRTPVARRRRI
jgi:O-antigen ligase